MLVLLLTGFSATLGSAPITIGEVYSAILHRFFSNHFETSWLANVVVWELRLPRILLGIIAGTGLAVAGTVMQAILRNPLASPFTLGIASAAAFGASLAMILGVGFVGGEYIIITNAFVFAMLASFLIYGLARYKGTTPETMILAGIAIMYLFSASTSLLKYFAEVETLQEVVFWMFGSLGRASWTNITIISLVLIACVPYLLWKSWDLNAMGAGDEAAKSLGVKVEQVRIVGMLLASLITASIICFTGIIGFIGLVCPHMTRMVIGGDHRFLLPASCVLGAVVLLGADTVARTIIAPVIIPVGIMTSFLGVPLFLYLLMRRKGEYW
ncbi:MAG: iron ABC transporter permease [Methanocellales archaeon]|nr:iron ABC transporter permease [Methanocellales archaeon]